MTYFSESGKSKANNTSLKTVSGLQLHSRLVRCALAAAMERMAGILVRGMEARGEATTKEGDEEEEDAEGEAAKEEEEN